MSFCNRVALPILAAVSLAFLVACGSSSNKATPPPTGGFTNSNLSGTYVFSTEGTDPTSGDTMSIVGAFTACGCSGGTISGGTFDYFDPSATTQLQTGNTINSGSYNVTADGRGQVTLLNNSSLASSITLDFVLNGPSGGMISAYNSFSGGSGTLELQSAATLGSNYAYSVSGENLTGPDAIAYAAAGAFTVSSGNFTAGVYDLTEWDLGNDTLAANIANASLQPSSSLALGTGTTPGTAVLNDPSGNTYTFDVYAVSGNDLKLFETDTTFAGATGDAFPQSTSLPSGTLAFTMNGVDGNDAPLSLGGLLTFSGTSITSGIEDFNDNGGPNTDSSVGGSFNSPITGGRASLQLTSFFNGASSGLNSTYTFAAYPTSNGTILLEIDGAGISAGNALVQTNTSLAASQGYGFNVSASNITGEGSTGLFEEDDIAEFTSTSSGFSGLVDVNDEGSTFFDKTFDGTYSSISTGRYTLAANSSSGFNGVSGAVYTVDGNTLLFLEGDTFQVGTGMLQVQNASGSDAQVSHHVNLFRQLAFKRALKRQQK
jgi:hypothetical protein